MCCGDNCGPCTGNRDEAAKIESVELQECRERLLRVTADLQNFQRRVERERLDWVAVGQIEVVRALLPIVDDLELALSAGGDQRWVDGLRLVHDKALVALKNLGVETILCEGMFDPELHEALATVECEGKAPMSVVEVLRNGYEMKGRVVRHAQVSVAK